MEEREQVKIPRTKKINSSNAMTVLTGVTIRGVVKAANEEGIKKEDIVSLLKENGQFVLIYFK